MDLAVRLCLLCLAVTPITGVLLANDGAWLAVAMAPYLCAYVAYRGAISAAQGYGGAVRYQIDIDRFALYDPLHVPRPRDTAAERQTNQQLMMLLAGRPANLRYSHKDPPG